MCPHAEPEVHTLGSRTVIACADCLVILDRDVLTFVKD